MFDVRIFANPAGYTELRLSSPNPMFSQDIVDQINFDGGELYINDSFSIFYSEALYVLTYNFDISSEAGFRGRRVHFAVAIKRGFAVNDVCAMFSELKSYFVELASMYRDSIQGPLYNNSHSVRAIVQKYIKVDDNLLKVNLREVNQGVVAYDNTKQVDDLLSSPNRMDLAGFKHVFILPREAVMTLWDKVKNRYRPIHIANYTYTPSYIVVFPDGHEISISGLDEWLSYKCEVPNYVSKTFAGTLRDNKEKWKVNTSEDGSRHTIPLDVMDAEVREYRVVFVGINTGKEMMPVSGSPDFTGIGLYDSSTNTLKLSGKGIEWGTYLSKYPGWTTPDYQVIRVEKDAVSDSIVRIVLTRYFDYYGQLLSHYRFFSERTGDKAVIYLSYNGNNLRFDPDADKSLYRKPYNYHDVLIVYEENSQYDGIQVSYNDNMKSFPLPKLQPKPAKKLSVMIKNAELQLKDLKFGCAYREDSEIQSEPVGKLPIEIDWKPGKALWIKVSASGYVTFEKKFSAYPDGGRIEIELKKTLFMKLLLPIVFFICALILFAAGGYVGSEYEKNKYKDLEKKHEQDMGAISAEKDALIVKIGELNTIIRDQQNQLGEKSTKDLEEDKKKAEKKQNRIKQLRSELLTQYFTQEDIDEYKRLIGGVDKYSIAAENCLYIINVKDRKERGTIWTPGTPLNKKMEEAGQVLPGFYNKIMKEQRASNDNDGKFKVAYDRTKVPENGFKSLDDAYKQYSNE